MTRRGRDVKASRNYELRQLRLRRLSRIGGGVSSGGVRLVLRFFGHGASLPNLILGSTYRAALGRCAIDVIGLRAFNFRRDDVARAAAGRRDATKAAPSICGASALVRPLASAPEGPPPGSSMMIERRLPIFALHQPRADRLLLLHEALPAQLLHIVGDGNRPSASAGAPATGSYLKAPARSISASSTNREDNRNPRRSTGEADNERRPQREVGTHLAPGANTRQSPSIVSWAFHGLQHARRGMLKRNVEIGKSSLPPSMASPHRHEDRDRRSAGGPKVRDRQVRAPGRKSAHARYGRRKCFRRSECRGRRRSYPAK